jgi:hypothetical protein
MAEQQQQVKANDNTWLAKSTEITVTAWKWINVVYFATYTFCVTYNMIFGHGMPSSIVPSLESAHTIITYIACIALLTKFELMWLYKGFSETQIDDIIQCFMIFSIFMSRTIITQYIGRILAHIICPFNGNFSACTIASL